CKSHDHVPFATAGKSPGLQVWRVEKMDLKPVPREFYGEFYTGDSYILLYTTSTPSYNVHTWIGEKSSLDEKAAAPIFMIQLDDFLNGKPVQYTEFQNDESVTFMSYFKAGIQYKQGGVSTGLKHAQSVEVKRLLHLKGRSSVRATEVDMSWGSFNQGDCFIIDLGENIFIWAGSKSNPFERLKSIDLAIEIRNNERAGKAVIHHIDEGSEPDVVLDVNKLPDKKNIPPTLYLISDAAGSMKTTKMADKPPFQQDALSNSDCYILDNAGDRKIFVWKGKDANPDERKAALTAANKFIKDKNYSPKTKVQIMPSGAENALFKHFFFNWIDKYETTGPSEAYTMGRIAQVPRIPFDSSTLHNNTAMAAQHGMVDDGSGDVKIYRVEDGDTVPVDPSTYGQFFGGDCYLVQYSYSTGARMRHIIYTWQGQKCSRDELTASAFLTVRMDDSMDKAAVQVRVTQGQEPAHLVSLFKNKPLVIHLGGTSRASGESKPASTRLYHIRQSCTKATRAVEVSVPSASSLNTNDVFVLKTPKALMLWVGKGGTPEEKEAAKYVAGMLGGTATEVQETKEPGEFGFWNALGGKKDYQTSKTLQESVKAPRLFNCSNKTGRLIAEEVPGEFTQLDLATDDVMILDTYDQIFAWVGKDANETEKTGSLKIAQEYLDSDPSGRSSIPVTKMKQGEELLSFTGWFHAWDPKMWDKDILQRINDRLKE
uniref:Scinderin like a n=1 Tax=Scophthalmus maximus TaxID=52904 RepID=A0A8D3BUG1_SCOMX